jgi:hypothetical protein
MHTCPPPFPSRLSKGNRHLDCPQLRPFANPFHKHPRSLRIQILNGFPRGEPGQQRHTQRVHLVKLNLDRMRWLHELGISNKTSWLIKFKTACNQSLLIAENCPHWASTCDFEDASKSCICSCSIHSSL